MNSVLEQCESTPCVTFVGIEGDRPICVTASLPSKHEVPTASSACHPRCYSKRETALERLA
jgi:hypothetical protein